MEDMKKENLSLQRSAMELREEVAQLRSERGTDHERLLDTEWRSMRDNLLFHGVPEEKDESSVESTLRGFLSPVSATMSSSYAVVTNDIYALTSAYWGLGCVFYQPGGAQMRCPKLTCSDILASRTYFTTGWC